MFVAILIFETYLLARIFCQEINYKKGLFIKNTFIIIMTMMHLNIFLLQKIF